MIFSTFGLFKQRLLLTKFLDKISTDKTAVFWGKKHPKRRKGKAIQPFSSALWSGLRRHFALKINLQEVKKERLKASLIKMKSRD